MSKKKTKKFKSHEKHHSQAQYSPATSVVTIPEIVAMGAEESKTEVASPVRAIAQLVSEKNEIEELNEKYSYVRHDVKRLMIVLSALALIFVGLYFVSIKTNLFQIVGDWVYRVSNFQI